MDNCQDVIGVHPHWNALIKWLSGHGMDVSEDKLPVQARSSPGQCQPKLFKENLSEFVPTGAGYGLFAIRSIEPAEALFEIPAKALMNSLTLAPHYPRSRPNFTCTQYISLHLMLHRPMKAQASMDPLFGPYISVLPQDFDSHPLTWLWKREHATMQSSLEHRLIETLPPRILAKLDKIANLFEIDWKTIQTYLRSNTTLLHDRTIDVKMEEDYLWAWLNVNTRCVYHRLTNSRSGPDNMTLCPVLDFANHTTNAPYTTPQPTKSEIWDSGPLGKRKFGDNFVLLSPSTAPTLRNEELFLRYGEHPNSTLFSEYGFVNAPYESPDGTYNGQIELEVLIERLLQKRGAVGSWMEEILATEGYWGDWTIHSSPEPAHPSYRLITTLRLYHLLPLSANTVPSNIDEMLDQWRNTTLGRQPIISEQNETLWRATLLSICNDMIAEAMAGIDRVRRATKLDVELSNSGHIGNWVKGSIKILWQEELDIAIAVVHSLENNEEF